ncbi:C-terminal processing protease CtpA/Prc, contains a PDZ domain [Variovorax sp. YR750]|uniref:S41 family peptidase n=1 Tax=Variovorax sp. YR750 TaxID=1884384 RepID=UPI0008C7AB4E|nr:S41 family peptidase [Variovorax sp. YR750]SEM20334.1 C-terminal processing protease CtpA/Prc, contains a PDZ domain [Variovorax sp. YR750]
MVGSRKVDDARRLPRPGAWAAAGAALAAAFLLAGCGGGGGGGGGGGLPIGLIPGTTTPPTNTPSGGDGIVASATVAGLCASPRSGINPDTNAAYPDRSGTIDNEKSWVRGWIDETYLWYGEVPTTLKAADYATPVTWFNVLKTTATTASGRAKDRFHFTYDTEVYRQLTQGGVSAGYGMETASVRSSPPRDIRIAFVEPGSPATNAGLQRGAKILTIDGINVVSSTGTANVNAINAALSPKAVGESHTFTFEVNGVAQSPVQLTAAKITSTPVQNVQVIDTGSGRVGYLLFNDHITTSESLLINAVNTFKQGAGIQDLVLDMRYNGGGQLLIASRLAYMIASPSATTGKTFEQLVFNDKNPFHLTASQTLTPFVSTSRSGQALPTLGLSRVTVLTGPDTCSASESVINSLRGVGVTVNLVGGTTCGKPYGFYPQDNCGTTYFAIQFKGVNQQGYGDYSDGFTPTAGCTVADDFGHQLGDKAEARLAAALALRSTGSCPVSTKTAVEGLEKAAGPEAEQPYLPGRSPLRENRLIGLPDPA